jgi:hypothetical protein
MAVVGSHWTFASVAADLAVGLPVVVADAGSTSIEGFDPLLYGISNLKLFLFHKLQKKNLNK